MFVIISKKKFKAMEDKIEKLEKGLKSVRQALSAHEKTQKEKFKVYDESLGKRYIHEAFENKSQEEIQSLIDEWQNGEDEDKGGSK